jgi:hypothetical protein
MCASSIIYNDIKGVWGKMIKADYTSFSGVGEGDYPTPMIHMPVLVQTKENSLRGTTHVIRSLVPIILRKGGNLLISVRSLFIAFTLIY